MAGTAMPRKTRTAENIRTAHIVNRVNAVKDFDRFSGSIFPARLPRRVCAQASLCGAKLFSAKELRRSERSVFLDSVLNLQ
jgi:hypothetical protein